ncbi:hypothetical protein [Nannocystis sp. SCPEA4]|uniref:hypothetical protein n=1 Tax=Nannocystis sp. SCPEA4 TaxID=2996787 RepID=UPI00226EBDB1|nr:hypothetical protein [Nannocystis sp. SCPEA4]MCY1054414.1 hypothetical protein [Nannocystis sp. SCPEA4]
MVCVLVAALLLLAPVDPGVSAAPGVSASDPGSAEARRGRARGAFERGSYSEAALEFEALWREGHVASDLFNAAASRIALRQHTHAVVHLEALLALPTLTPAQREEASALLRTARTETRAVPIELRTPRPLDDSLAITVSFVAAYATEQRPDLTFTVRPAERTVLSLDPGVWRLSVSDPRFESVTQEVRVEAAGAAPQIFELRPRPDGRALRRFTLAWSGAGAAGIVVGASLLGVGQGRWSANLDGPIETCQGGEPLYAVAACRRAIASAGTLRTAGAAVLGVGAGALIGGLVARVADPKKRRLGWIVTASIGGLATVGGAVALGLGAQAFGREDDRTSWTDSDRSAIGRAGATHTVGGVFLGLGGGMLASAVTGLLLDRSGRFQLAAGPQFRVGGASLVFEGRF